MQAYNTTKNVEREVIYTNKTKEKPQEMSQTRNFRTGCAVLTHLLGVYGCGNLTDALTAYNTGHGGASEYARDVLEKQGKWQGVLGYE